MKIKHRTAAFAVLSIGIGTILMAGLKPDERFRLNSNTAKAASCSPANDPTVSWLVRQTF